MKSAKMTFILPRKKLFCIIIKLQDLHDSLSPATLIEDYQEEITTGIRFLVLFGRESCKLESRRS